MVISYHSFFFLQQRRKEIKVPWPFSAHTTKERHSALPPECPVARATVSVRALEFEDAHPSLCESPQSELLCDVMRMIGTILCEMNHGWVDGWMDGGMEGGMDGGIDGWMGKRFVTTKECTACVPP
jgi:hypothetical protein